MSEWLEDWHFKFTMQVINERANELVSATDPREVAQILDSLFGLRQSLRAHLRKMDAAVGQ